MSLGEKQSPAINSNECINGRLVRLKAGEKAGPNKVINTAHLCSALGLHCSNSPLTPEASSPESEPSPLKQTFNCVHIIQLDSAAAAQRPSPGFHLGNGLQAGAGSSGLKRGLGTRLLARLTPSPGGACPAVSRGQSGSIRRPAAPLVSQASDSNPDPAGVSSVQHPGPCHPFPPTPAITHPAPCLTVKDPRRHSADPINKELRKFIRKRAFYGFRESPLPTSVTEKG